MKITQEDIKRLRSKPHCMTYQKIGEEFGVSRQWVHQVLNPRQPQPKYWTVKTHCKRGHPFEGDNLRTYNIKGKKMRQCVACTKIHSKNRVRV